MSRIQSVVLIVFVTIIFGFLFFSSRVQRERQALLMTRAVAMNRYLQEMTEQIVAFERSYRDFRFFPEGQMGKSYYDLGFQVSAQLPADREESDRVILIGDTISIGHQDVRATFVIARIDNHVVINRSFIRREQESGLMTPREVIAQDIYRYAGKRDPIELKGRPLQIADTNKPLYVGVSTGEYSCYNTATREHVCELIIAMVKPLSEDSLVENSLSALALDEREIPKGELVVIYRGAYKKHPCWITRVIE